MCLSELICTQRRANALIIYYNAQDRKPLVTVIGEFTGANAVYMRTPTYAYRIDYFTVTREGNLEFDDRSDSEEIENLLETLAKKGFTAENAETLDNKPTTTEPLAQGNTAVLTIEVPIDCVKVENLTALLDAKGTLIKKALGIEKLPIEVKEDRVSFPWFSETTDSETAKAYTHFIFSLCEMTVNHKRVNSSKKVVENEKYAFRCFLLRLGFIGDEYKTERRILLKNLTGSSAFRGGSKNEISG